MAESLTIAEPKNSDATEILHDDRSDRNDSSNAPQRKLAGPERLMTFLHDVREEMRKVITPTREQVQSATIVVLATVFIFAAYFEVVDLVLGKGIDKLLVWAVKH